MSNRPPIPEPIKHTVRKKCGFGCVICGLPLYEYEHVIDWSIVKEHHADNIVLLCPNHHSEKTRGRLTREQIQQAAKNPVNLARGWSTAYGLHFEGRNPIINMGGHKFIGDTSDESCELFPLLVDNIPLISISIEKQDLFLSLQILSEYNLPVLQVMKNELIYSTDVWDIQYIGPRLMVRNDERKILIDINFVPPNRIDIMHGRFLANGVEILIEPGYIAIGDNNLIIGGEDRACKGGIVIGDRPPGIPAARYIASVNRYADNSLNRKEWINSILNLLSGNG